MVELGLGSSEEGHGQFGQKESEDLTLGTDVTPPIAGALKSAEQAWIENSCWRVGMNG